VLTLVVTYLPLLGGSERSLLELTGGLPGKRVLACPEGRLADRARAAGVSVTTIPAGPAEWRGGVPGRVASGRGLAVHGREVRRLVRELEPDLLVAWGLHTAIVAPAALSGLHQRPGLLSALVDFLPGPPVDKMARAAVARADRVVVNSKAVGRDLDPAGALGDRLAVVRPGVELADYDRDWGRAPDPEVLVLGELTARKRPDLALDAVALAARDVPPLRATISGATAGPDGERLLEALRRRAARPDLEGRVTFAGVLDDPRQAISRAWCLLHCADREPFDTAVLQALASGRPVVAAAGAAEVVDESCGRLYPPGDAAAAAAALVDVVSNPGLVDELGAGGRARAGWFGADEAIGRFAGLAMEVVGEGDTSAGAGGSRRRFAAYGTGLALVTVTYNSTATIDGLLRSVEQYLPEAQMIVVDSGSTDESARAARAAAPRATVVELGENVGFGRASNAGVDLVDRPVTVLINPDAELVDGSLADLAAELMTPGAPERILAPLVLSPDGSRQDNVHLDPESPLRWVHALIPPAALPAALRPLTDPSQSRRRRPVGWAIGACLVASTETLRRLGPFDERIFMFSEDTDLGLRANEAGVPTVFCPDARVLHVGAHSTDAAYGGEPYELLERQRRAVIGERRGEDAALRDDRIWVVTYMNRILLKRLTGHPTARERLLLAALQRAREEPARLERP
jgi:GT2 family glycosyltransferase/glycosyltransferase involved in cell wall biosynthesis